MTKNYSGSAVPRHFVFIMANGAFVVQLNETRVQDLLTGQFIQLTDDNYGHAITDYELSQLKVAGRVEHYDHHYVWLYSLPEPHLYDNRHTQDRIPSRVRSYYLNTTLPESRLNVVQAMLAGLELTSDVAAASRGDLVVIVGKNGSPFPELKEAESVQKELSARAPHLFQKAVVAFTEGSELDSSLNTDQVGGRADLASIIASQTDTSVTDSKQVVLLLSDADERAAIHELCAEMHMQVQVADSGAQALELLEDGHSDLLLMDLQPPDMHAWAMLAKVREISDLRQLPIIVLAEHSMSNQQSMALAVAKVDVYLVRPVSKSRLRQNIWMALKEHQRA
ncbi:MAG: response regulator [Anaerolineae bacterium]|nr:response regulator [Anaerolineae bacterium]